MKKTRLSKIAAIISAAVIMITMSVPTFAADTTPRSKPDDRMDIWSVLTDEQKEQLMSEATARLAQELADGKITQAQYDERVAAISNGEMPFGKREGPVGEEQTATMDSMKAKWDALTDEQKAEIYSLFDQKNNIESQIVDKYLEFGLIDSETAAAMKQSLETQKSDMRTNGRVPMAGGRGFRGDRPAPAN